MTNKQSKTTSNPKVKNTKEDKKLLIAVDDKKKKARDNIVDEWLIEHFRNKLKKAVAVVNRLNKPLALYSNILEESEDAAKEEIVLHNQKYITVQIFTRGGFIPTSFQEQYVFTIDKFIWWILKERKNRRAMILQCLETLQNVEIK